MSTTYPFTIHPLDPQQASQRLEQIVAVYRAAFAEPPYDRTAAEVHLFRTSFRGHCQREGFYCVAALQGADEGVIGFAYGYTCRPGQWWYERVLAAAGPDFGPSWLEGSFQVAEVAVHPDWQGRGAGTRLMEALMHDRPQPQAVLSTIDLDTPASKLYLRRGWQVLVKPMQFPGVTRPYKILGRRLEHPAAEGEE